MSYFNTIIKVFISLDSWIYLVIKLLFVFVDKIGVLFFMIRLIITPGTKDSATETC